MTRRAYRRPCTQRAVDRKCNGTGSIPPPHLFGCAFLGRFRYWESVQIDLMCLILFCMSVIHIKYVCTLAMQQKCFEPCHHSRPHRAAFGCHYDTCLNESRSCIPFVGKFDLCIQPQDTDKFDSAKS